jgi:diacylglycerol diphosphate phosphatase/phosphatidate phosphatase
MSTASTTPPPPPPANPTSTPDLESASPPQPRRRHPLAPGFNHPSPSFLVFLRDNWLDIATQLLCVLAAYLLYLFCPPLMPRYFMLYPGIEHSDWGMRHSAPYLKEYVDTTVSGVVSFVVPVAVMGAVALWGSRGFGDGNAAVSFQVLDLEGWRVVK